MSNQSANLDRIKQLLRQDVPVVEIEGRWYITAGQPGFNTLANNTQGYASEDVALTIIALRSAGGVK
jgi:hypothetical protein